MIACKRSSTSSKVQPKRKAFCDISRPEVATPPALDALPGAYKIFASTNFSTASKVEGMFAPSATQITPFARSTSASA